MQILKFLGIQTNREWIQSFIISIIAPILIIFSGVFDLDFNQRLLVAALILTVTWWSKGIIARIPASIFLVLTFVLLRAAPLRTIFSFPLSETFIQIVLTYIFSRGIVNCGLIEKLIEPRLLSFCKTPVRVIYAIIILYIFTIYIIPQPLARLIIITNIMDAFLKETDLCERKRAVLMFASFVFYTVVNLSLLDADIIMNNAAVRFGEQNISNLLWAKYMILPTLVYGILIFFIFVLLFKRDLIGFTINSKEKKNKSRNLNNKDKAAIFIICMTIVLWMSSSLHLIAPIVITAIGTIALFAIGIVKPKDFLAVDITNLIFLTAAFSIGGAMKGSGVADKIFGQFSFLFPKEFGLLYLFMIVFVAMLIHMILGSNVTTLSVVTPALLVLSNGVLSGEMLVYILVAAVSFHAILPFHNVAIMIGNSKGYYTSDYVIKFGILTTPLVFLAVLFIYYPWWYILGLR